MLTKSILDTMHEAAGIATFAPAVSSTELAANKAANANRFDSTASMERRNRRMRRAERNAARTGNGWTVRMW